ncbi:MAG: hypothetical protein WC977_04400 [Anaerovoracaceae bacterium]|jgi:hypothetical protein
MKHRVRWAVAITWIAGACQGALVMATHFVSLDVAVVFVVSMLNMTSVLLAGDASEEGIG